MAGMGADPQTQPSKNSLPAVTQEIFHPIYQSTKSLDGVLREPYGSRTMLRVLARPATSRAGGPPRAPALRVLVVGLLVAVLGFPGLLLGAELHLRESLLAAHRDRVTTTELSPTFSRPTMTGIEHRHAAAGFIPLLTDYPA